MGFSAGRKKTNTEVPESYCQIVDGLAIYTPRFGLLTWSKRPWFSREPTANETSNLESAMTSVEPKNEMLVMVLIDLAEICKKLADNSAVPDTLRAEARKFREEFDSLLPDRGKGTPAQHAQAETLVIRIARFLPKVVEGVQAAPRSHVA